MIKLRTLILIWLVIILGLLFWIKSEASYTRATGAVTLTAPKSASYQWQVNRGKRWVKIVGATSRKYRIVATKRMNGYKYRCKLKKGYSKTDKLTVTDINVKYWRNITPVNGLLLPKCADGYVYVWDNTNFTAEVKTAIKTINSKTGRLFIWTETPHIADIVILEWTGTKLADNIWLRDDEIETIKQNGKKWAGVTWSIDGQHYLVGINRSVLDMWYSTYEERYAVAVIMHELCHCVGIPHSNRKGELMGTGVNLKLTKNDVAMLKQARKRIRSLM